MPEEAKPTAATDLSKLVAQFQALKGHEEQCKFYHDNPELHPVIRGVLFPKPVKASNDKTE